MATHAYKLVIVTEKLLFRHIARIAEAAGATGYTVSPADGRGSRNTRLSEHPSMPDNMDNIKVEIITADEAVARSIADEVATKYFENFSGIAYLDPVEVLYSHRL